MLSAFLGNNMTNYNVILSVPPNPYFTPLVVPKQDVNEVLWLGAIFDPVRKHYYIPHNLPNRNLLFKWVARGRSQKNALKINLLPTTVKPAALRWYLETDDWKALSREVRAAKGDRCEFCGGAGRDQPSQCSEVYTIDDQSKIVTLSELVSVCRACYICLHIDQADGRGIWHAQVNHLAYVNNISREMANQQAQDAIFEWNMRSECEWALDLDHLAEYGLQDRVKKTGLIL